MKHQAKTFINNELYWRGKKPHQGLKNTEVVISRSLKNLHKIAGVPEPSVNNGGSELPVNNKGSDPSINNGGSESPVNNRVSDPPINNGGS